jgi:hypothetical protein
MDQKDLFLQLVNFNKKAFENTFNAVVVFQDQSESLFKGMLDQATWLPEDKKAGVGDWVKSYKKTRDDFRKSVDDGFKKLEELINKPFPGEQNVKA